MLLMHANEKKPDMVVPGWGESKHSQVLTNGTKCEYMCMCMNLHEAHVSLPTIENCLMILVPYDKILGQLIISTEQKNFLKLNTLLFDKDTLKDGLTCNLFCFFQSLKCY